MVADFFEKMTGKKHLDVLREGKENSLAGTLKILAKASLDRGVPEYGNHISTVLKKASYHVMNDPSTSPRKKWNRLLDKIEVTYSDKHRRSVNVWDSSYVTALTCAAALLKLDPSLRKDTAVVKQIRNTWSNYAESSEVGSRPGTDHTKSWDGKKLSEGEMEQDRKRRAQTRAELPKFLNLTRDLLDIIKPKMPGEEYDMYEYWSRYIPELKDLR
jgi:hypothetical protein